MREKILVMLLPGMLLWWPLYAQTPSKVKSLTEAELNGKKLFEQRCSICHTPPVPGGKVYGPWLSAVGVIGKEAAVRQVILKGTERMPGFQYGLEPEEIDNIIAYLKTVKETDTKNQEEKKTEPDQRRD